MTATRNTDSKTHILDTAQRLVGGRGFSAVGLNEIVKAAGVPKGSFYHYFASKEDFGKELLEHYFQGYLCEIEEFLSAPGRNARDRLTAYWAFWRNNQERQDPDGKCLAVKLGAEVSDISEEMRLALKVGTSAIIMQIARVLREGKTDGSIAISGSATATAQTLYQLWLGASVMDKISRDGTAFNNAVATTKRILSAGAS
jgi:TetR/AcrR family transcriptional repressor of nem operon